MAHFASLRPCATACAHRASTCHACHGYGARCLAYGQRLGQGLALACLGWLLCAMSSALAFTKPSLARCELARTAQAAPKALPLRH